MGKKPKKTKTAILPIIVNDFERDMKTRRAHIQDAKEICKLINFYAERGIMLHRSHESIYDSLREFIVVVDENEKVRGCVAVDIFWADLAEIRSLAVSKKFTGRGVGKMLIEAAIKDAAAIGIKRLFALTYTKDFFENFGFKVIDKNTLPDKVWTACLVCPKADACDEIAVIKEL